MGNCSCTSNDPPVAFDDPAEPNKVESSAETEGVKNGANVESSTDHVCHAICGIPKSQHTGLYHDFVHPAEVDNTYPRPMIDIEMKLEEREILSPMLTPTRTTAFSFDSDRNPLQSPVNKASSPHDLGLRVTIDDGDAPPAPPRGPPTRLSVEVDSTDSVGKMLALPSPGGRRKRRMSVSAESDNASDSACGSPRGKDYNRNFFPRKTFEQKERINAALSHCFLFNNMDQEQEKKIIDAMEEKKVKAGDSIIKQYDDGDFFYVIDSGKYDVLKETDPEGEPGVYKNVFAYDNKGSFGELALMYNCPRAASVTAASDGVLWAVDRYLFRQIVVRETAEKRARHEDFLRRVPILAKLSQIHISQMADGLHPRVYPPGSTIVKQGDIGEAFYVVEKGECVATQGNVELGRIKSGSYFGERALLTNEPRSANVLAEGETTCLTLDRATFERLFNIGNQDTVQEFHTHIKTYKTAEEITKGQNKKNTHRTPSSKKLKKSSFVV